MTISNGAGGNTSGSPVEEMAAYDRLPPPARALIGSYAYPLDCRAMLHYLANYFAGDVRRWATDAKPRLQQMRDAQIGLMWAPGHPDIGKPLNEDWT